MSTLPSRISYSTLRLDLGHDAGVEISIPRRELFDIRAQLMAEDTQIDPQLLVGIDQVDIKTNVYEGGFKTWECSLDLAKYVAEIPAGADRSRDQSRHYIEVRAALRIEYMLRSLADSIQLGCGTALPAISFFQACLSSPSSRPIRITLADYNHDVLRLATLPNLLLSWAMVTKGRPGFPPEDDLELTPAFLGDFLADIEQRDIHIDFISGAWGEQFLDLLDHRPRDNYTFVLASETIYSPSTLRPFTTLLMHLISSIDTGSGNGRALIAAKNFYFGVGGGVDEFLHLLASMGGEAREVVTAGEEGRGVARVVLEVVRS